MVILGLTCSFFKAIFDCGNTFCGGKLNFNKRNPVFGFGHMTTQGPISEVVTTVPRPVLKTRLTAAATSTAFIQAAAIRTRAQIGILRCSVINIEVLIM